jgi:hypothetical protein
MNSSKPLRGTGVELYFRGKEYTKVLEHGMGSGTAMDTAYGKHQFIRIDIPVASIGSILCNDWTAPGLHKIPFRIQLPSYIPSTMSISTVGGRAAIAY